MSENENMPSAPQYPAHQPVQPAKPKKRGRKVAAGLGVAAVLLVGIGIGASGGEDPAPKAAPEVTQKPEPKPEPTQEPKPEPKPEPEPEVTPEPVEFDRNPTEQLFLEVLHNQADTTGWTDDDLIIEAKYICRQLDNGATFVDVFLQYSGTGDESLAGAIAGAGVVMFCPDHEPAMNQFMNTFGGA